MKFDFSRHWESSFFNHCKLKPFYEYCSNENSIESYLHSLDYKHCDEQGNIYNIDPPQALVDGYKSDILGSLMVVTNQMIVYLFSRYEFMVEDFATCIFSNRPMLITGMVNEVPELKDSMSFSLKGFLKSDTKESYIVELSNKIAKSILSNTPEKVIKRLGKVSNIEIEMSILLTLNELMEKRNNIVHEGHMYKLNFDDLDIYYNVLEEFLRSLAITLVSMDIGIVDRGNLLADIYK